MKIVRFEAGHTAKYGIRKGDQVLSLSTSPFSADWDPTHPEFDNDTYEMNELTLLAPCEPTKFLGIGLNFVGAARTLGRPLPTYPNTFLKPSGSVIGTGHPIILTEPETDRYLYEGELGVVIGKTASRVREEEVYSYVLGYTCTNDITDMSYMDKDMLKVKCQDTFGVVGPCIETDLDPMKTCIRCWKNGELKQEGFTNEMVFSVAYMVHFFSQFMTLFPGDVISMGTPGGAGEFGPGDVLKVEIDGIGSIENTGRSFYTQHTSYGFS